MIDFNAIANQLVSSHCHLIHETNVARMTLHFARIGAEKELQGQKAWVDGLDEETIRELERNDFYKGRTKIIRQYFDGISPSTIFRFELLQVAIAMETFIGELVKWSVQSEILGPPQAEKKIEEHLGAGIGKQLRVINRIVRVEDCPSYAKYREIRACRNCIVHHHDIASNLYVKEAGIHARAKAGEVLPLDEAYVHNSFIVIIGLASEIINKIVSRRDNKA